MADRMTATGIKPTKELPGLDNAHTGRGFNRTNSATPLPTKSPKLSGGVTSKPVKYVRPTTPLSR